MSDGEYDTVEERREGATPASVRPVTCGSPACLVASRYSEQRGLIAGLTRALKMSKSVKNNSKGMLALQAYLKSQVKLSEEVPF